MIEPGDVSTRRWAPEVFFVHAGEFAAQWPDGVVVLGSGDTITVPRRLERTLFTATSRFAYRVSHR